MWKMLKRFGIVQDCSCGPDKPKLGIEVDGTVVPIGGGGGTQQVLLWENDNPAAYYYSSRTLTLPDMSEYDEIKIVCLAYSYAPDMGMRYAYLIPELALEGIAGKKYSSVEASAAHCNSGADVPYVYTRNFTMNSSTALKVWQGMTNGASSDNTQMIPIRIYGIKYTG